jgi:hypothetical protein
MVTRIEVRRGAEDWDRGQSERSEWEGYSGSSSLAGTSSAGQGWGRWWHGSDERGERTNRLFRGWEDQARDSLPGQ